MPELPDVEDFRRTLDSCARGRRVEHVEVADSGVLRGLTPQRMRRALTGRTVAGSERRGKWLLARTDGPTLLLHFGMTGRLACLGPEDRAARHDRVTLALDDGRRLAYRDQRKLRGLWLAFREEDVGRVIGDQGPDALSLTRSQLDGLLAGRRARVKAVLTDQSALAGLGNLLGDEILWRARIAPARRADDLGPDERGRLATALRQVLRDSVRAGHVPTRDSWLTGHRDDPDATCPRCGGPLARDRIAGRTTAWCPHCQRPAS
ncbi:DNA-formamidopyrimidine glycosylase family protein [Streptomyces sp. DSM 44917]|uniref:DNA-formamidopyrimidine glycosylase family protein n=1 Tax=Streptomyces boetiae TaxID=3075541 RepID=A0ABU2L5U8_9ACTN|nr:DNA-formamidopyrimidine glycosylase family protein [Streptomyces sp. DSM 44917]MDT0306608.1 DNA-formamidopyrimidine glycosylase family protein [Streptomyces sp. DSM 44917]